MKKLKKARKTYTAKKINVNIKYKTKLVKVAPKSRTTRVHNVTTLKKHFRASFDTYQKNLANITRLSHYKDTIKVKTPKWYLKENDNKKLVQGRNIYNLAFGVSPATLNNVRTKLEIIYRHKNIHPKIIEQYNKNFDKYIGFAHHFRALNKELKETQSPSKKDFLKREIARIKSEMLKFEKEPSKLGFTNAVIDEQTGERFFELPNYLENVDQQERYDLAKKLTDLASSDDPYGVDDKEDYSLGVDGYTEEFTREIIDDIAGGWENIVGSNPDSISYIAKYAGMKENELHDWYVGIGEWKGNVTLDKIILNLKKFRK